MKVIDLTGQRFGRLVAIRRFRRIGESGRSRVFWSCKCDCGNDHEADASALRRGYCKSCGCMQRELAAERATTHGKSFTKLHRTWTNIKSRCLNNRVKAFRNYGGRGIKIHPEWITSFEAFASYVGEPPSNKHSIDRWPDNDGNYEPGNVRWATAKEQGRNRSGLIVVSAAGEEFCLSEAAERAGLPYSAVYTRIFRWGWDLERAISTPSQRRGR